MFKASIGAFALTGALLLVPQVRAAEVGRPTRVAYMVVSQDQAVADKFKSYIGSALKANAGYEVSDKAPLAELILFVSRDVNDRVNPHGLSIAIAHVSNATTYFVANKFLVQEPTKDEGVRSALTSMVRENGFLEHLSVAHLDDSSDREIKLASDSIVSTFFQKIPANIGR